MTDQQPAEPRVSQLDRVKQEYTQAAREILQRSMRGVAKTKLTPDMLTLAGVSLCLAGAVLVGFEQRNEKLFFWLGGALFVVGSVADILDGALARAASKGTVFGAFLDSTFDRLGEAAMLTAIGLVFMRDGNEIALVATFAAVIGSFLVSYTRAKAEALGLRGDVGFGSRVERVVLISVGLLLAPWGLLQWPIYLLAAIGWVTVVQRMLFVRRQLRELAEQTGGVEIGWPGTSTRASDDDGGGAHGDRASRFEPPSGTSRRRSALRRASARSRISPRRRGATSASRRPRHVGAAVVPVMRSRTARVSSSTSSRRSATSAGARRWASGISFARCGHNASRCARVLAVCLLALQRRGRASWSGCPLR